GERYREDVGDRAATTGEDVGEDGEHASIMRPPPSRPHELRPPPHADFVKTAQAANRYPTPGSVRTYLGPSDGSILRRRLAMWARRTWKSSSYSTPQTSTRRARWVISLPRLRASAPSRPNSVGGRWTSSPSRSTVRAAESISSPSAASVASPL